MKKIISLGLAVLLSLFAFGCVSSSGESSGNGNSESTVWKVDETVMPFWKTNKIKNESILLVKEDISTPQGKLLFTPTEILSVVSYDNVRKTTVTYTLGEDFSVEGNVINAISDKMPFMTEDQVSGKERLAGFDYTQIPSTDGGLYLPFTEGSGFIERQIYVTYTYEEEWVGEKPKFAGDKLPKTIDKLSNKKDFELMIFGDSISTGANSTGVINVYPNEKSWPEKVWQSLETQYETKIGFLNKSVGGWTSENAIKSTESIGWVNGVQITQKGIGGVLEEMPNYKPDLVILGFGMNDATAGINKKTYKLYMQRIITLIRERNPECEFILLGTMLANPKALNQSKNQISYYEKLEELAQENKGVACVNIGKMHGEMLDKGKKYIDMTGNNVNHPNDFLASVYSMNILSLLIGE
ncbi:MAG: SGNH/GDSL hydrolase family protein [Clostridiales bacterium]|nr:SGNH/GDSL hydrolase family protein [Clostridiales bacterium]